MPVICAVVKLGDIVELEGSAVCETAMTVGVLVIATEFVPDEELIGVPGLGVLEDTLALTLLGTALSDGVVAVTTIPGTVLGDEPCVSITSVAVIVA